jgi:predicted ATP-dependent protease
MNSSQELSAADVRRSTDPGSLGFSSTDELPRSEATGGQHRAEEAIDLALHIADRRYNLYVSGRSGSGRLSSVLKMVTETAATQAAELDWCYVHNFDRPDEPQAISLPVGSGQAFADTIDNFVVGCRRELRRVFASEGYRQQRDALLREIMEQRARLLAELERDALAHGFLLQETQFGVTMLPVRSQPLTSGVAQAGASPLATPSLGNEAPPQVNLAPEDDGAQRPGITREKSAQVRFAPLSPEEFAELSVPEQRHVREEHEHVEESFAAAMPKLRELEAEARARIERLQHETSAAATQHLVTELSARYASHERITDFIRHLQRDILAHADVVRGNESDAEAGVREVRPDNPAGPDGDPATDEAAPFDHGSLMLDDAFKERPAVAALLRRYRINVLVAHKSGVPAPVIQEINPSYLNLLGRIEFGLQGGLPYTDHLMIKAGAFHKANGGYLILQAAPLLGHPHAWEAVKRVVRFGVIGMENSEEPQLTPVSASLRPEPISGKIKVILIGDPAIYAALLMLDPEFGELFKVRADFDDEMERTPEAERFYCRYIAEAAQAAGMPPLTSQAVAALIDEGSRLVEDQRLLSTRLRDIQDFTLEAGYAARRSGASLIGREHIAEALAAEDRRNGLLSDKLDRLIAEHAILIDTSGARVGQVNGLTILSSAGNAFGKPARITARTSPGLAGIVNLERETQMSGPAHSKGILILTGFLAGRYATDYPLSLLGSICFEQIYGEIEGDSASSAELYAVLSSLSGLPIRQGLAVTGSVNQHGEVQAVGGVNQKIEGFFAVCSKDGGLTGDQGVIIPRANVRNLMLREPVVSAVQSGAFHIYGVSSIDEGIELLTGVPAGERDAFGAFPEKTVNWYVHQTLRRYYEQLHSQGNAQAAAPVAEQAQMGRVAARQQAIG